MTARASNRRDAEPWAAGAARPSRPAGDRRRLAAAPMSAALDATRRRPRAAARAIAPFFAGSRRGFVLAFVGALSPRPPSR